MSMMRVMDTTPEPSMQPKGISRNLALGRVLHFEALMRRRMGEVRAQRYVRLYNYYANQALPPDNVDMPLGINRFKSIVDKHANYLWGEWKNNLFEWRVTPLGREDMDPVTLQDAQDYATRIKLFLQQQLGTGLDDILWQASKNSGIYGDGVLEVHYDEVFRRVVVESILPEYFHAMWEISNMRNLVEVIVAYPIDRAMALETYGTSGNDQFLGYTAINPHYLPGIGVLWKRWSTSNFQVWVDDVNVYNSPNPYMPIDNAGNYYPGIIPFIHIKNMPGGADYWGYSDGENVLQLIDELNRRMADIGDIVSTHAHPIVALSNFSGQVTDLPIGPDAVWDLGRDGKAERLEGIGPTPELMAYIEAVKKEMHETASMPETAYGSKSGSASHSSGLALAMAMMPVVERAREKRIYWRAALRKLAQMTFYLYAVRDPAILEAAGLTYGRVIQFDIDSVFADVLPKEQLQTVNEAVALFSNNLRSQYRALEDLGEDDIPAEIERIKQDMALKAQMGAPSMPAEGGTAGQNSDQGVGGSPGLPGGISAGLSKPGTMIKSPDQDKLDNVSMGQELG